MSFIKKIKKSNIFIISFIFIIISYIIRIAVIIESNLIDDEAYFALWTQHLPFGFFDHGPGVAFLMKITMSLFGENGFGVRIGGIIVMIITSFFIYKFCKKHKDENTAIITVILFNSIPFFAGLALIITPDTPMFYFLILSIMAYYEAIYSNKKYFYLAGALFGFSLLSKEGAIFIGATIVLFILISKNRKYILTSKEFYLSFLMAFIVYSPFIIYNFQTDFIFIQFALDRQLQKPGSIKNTLDLWGAQIGLFSPLFLILFIYLSFSSVIKFFKKKEIEKTMYFALISLVPLIYIIQKSFKNKLEANWPLFMYAGGIFLVGFFISKYWNKKSIKILFFINIIFCNLLILFITINYFIPIVNIKGDPIDRYYKYNSIRYDLKKYYENSMDKNLRIFGLNYQIPSLVNFYVKPEIESVTLNFGTYHPTSFDFWYEDSEFIGNDMYFIQTSNNANFLIENGYFDSVEPITNFTSYRNDKKLDTFYVYLCKNYKGNNLDFIYEGNRFKF